MSKTILILGGGIMQIPSITCGRKKGWGVVVADGNPDAPGKRFCHHFEHVDLKDREGMYQAAVKHSTTRGLDGVFTAGTDFSTTVAYVAEKLGLPGVPLETAERASDKERMRTCFLENRIPSPRFWAFSSLQEVAETGMEFPYPVVVKPVDNMGARGIRKVSTREELLSSLPDAFSFSRSSRIIIEEYLPGPEYSTDALVWDGTIHMCGFADRHIFFDPYFVELGHTMPTCAGNDVKEQVEDLFFRGIEAIGITQGAAKGDIKLTPEGPVVGEIAARLSGGYMSGWTFPFHSGVDVTGAALNIAVGESPGDLVPVRSDVAAERAFISIPGIVSDIRGVESAREIPGIREVFLGTSKGKRVCFPTNNVQKCGNVIAVMADRDRAIRSAREGTAHIDIALEPGTPETAAFISRVSEPWAPDAYCLECNENIQTLKDMVPGWGRPGGKCRLVLSLPAQERECGSDWNGLLFQAGLDRVMSRLDFQWIGLPEQAEGESFLGSVFWNAFIRGGYQGGIWVVETFNTVCSDSKKIDNFIETWQ